jgi:acetate kinase
VVVRDIQGSARAILTSPETELTRDLSAAPLSYSHAVACVLEMLDERSWLDKVDAVGHRVVHGGPSLTGPVELSPEVLHEIEQATNLAPLHNRPALDAIAACRLRLQSQPMVALFDTDFFRHLPAVAATYAIPSALAREHGIRRYGFHGLAHRHMAERAMSLAGREDLRLVTLQMGGGCSAAALRGLTPVDTSMGLTPLEGLVMSTRSGDLDPALPGVFARTLGIEPDDIERILNEESGLLGVSGRSGDISQLLQLEAGGDALSALALEVFCYRARKYIGAYAAALGGLDAIAFGGGIGENQPEIRSRIVGGLEWLGLKLDPGANSQAVGIEASIHSAAAGVALYVLPVDEERLIALDTARYLRGRHE